MAKPSTRDRLIGVTEFKPRCLSYIQDVATGRVERVILTRHGRPVAAIVPADSEEEEVRGALRGRAWISLDVDVDA